LTGLPTTSEDNVYIYYDNHGGPGILGVPDGCGGYITAKELSAAFDTMASKNNYKYIFFGLEACYSGSIAEIFKAPRMVTITAANNKESSYAAVMDSAVGTYLTNEFSNYWMAEMDNNPEETIGDIFENVKSKTKGSHVCFYGDASMKTMKISEFLGTPNKIEHVPNRLLDIVPQEVATKTTLQYLIFNHDDLSVRARARLEKHRVEALTKRLDIVLEEIAKSVDAKNFELNLSAKDTKINDAYYQVLNHFFNKFGEINGDDLPKMFLFVNLAAKHPVKEIIAAIDATL